MDDKILQLSAMQRYYKMKQTTYSTFFLWNKNFYSTFFLWKKDMKRHSDIKRIRCNDNLT